MESLAGDFEPGRYRDTYREEVLALIERKAAGEEIAVQPPREESAPEVPDLMSALQASLQEVRGRTGGAPTGRKPKPAAKRSGLPGSLLAKSKSSPAAATKRASKPSKSKSKS